MAVINKPGNKLVSKASSRNKLMYLAILINILTLASCGEKDSKNYEMPKESKQQALEQIQEDKEKNKEGLKEHRDAIQKLLRDSTELAQDEAKREAVPE